MVPLLICIPFLLTIYFLSRHPAQDAMLYVYIPCLMLAPLYLKVWVKGVSIDPASLVGLVIAMAGIASGIKWKFRITDLFVPLLAVSAFYADAHYRPATLGIFAATQLTLTMIAPYFIGRTLIEANGMRVQVAKCVIICLCIVAVISLWEYRMTSNLFQAAVEKVTGHPAEWGRQMRWGFARVAGPYGHAISAGMMFSCGLILQIWLRGSRLWGGTASARRTTGLNASTVTTALVVGGLFMTQSRGPWIGCGLGLIVALVGLAKNRKRAAIAAGIVLAISLSVTYKVLDAYTDVGSFRNSSSLDQQNASYRRELIATYSPLIKEGGFWGWGTPFPVVDGGIGMFAGKQPSIDNEYLRMAMAQGYFGTFLEIALFVCTIVRLVRCCVTFREREDSIFAFSMLGLVVATSFSLTTVFLGEPVVQLFFLCCGWAQSAEPSRQEALTASITPNATQRFSHVFV